MKKLRIATFVTSHFTIPGPRGIIYAPLDVAADLCGGLAERGHRVDFYAPIGSRVRGCRMMNSEVMPLQKNFKRIFGVGHIDEGELYKIYNLWDQYLLSELYRRAQNGSYDIIHIHPIDRAMPLARIVSGVPTVYTLHDPIDPWRAKLFKLFASENQHLITISNAQRKPAPQLNYKATVYNGINTRAFSFSPNHDNYLFFVGRLRREKGVHEAIRAARKTGERLLIAGNPASGEYWDTKIRPYLGGKIKYVGNVERTKLSAYYQKAKATLVPIQWEEPFGLVMAESMACGTPVIAFNRGSVPEVVQNGKTGFIVDTVQEMAAAIKRIATIDRAECRTRVEKKFSAEKMTDEYEKLFLKITKK